jgi:addiction module RelE/StbE family toxin
MDFDVTWSPQVRDDLNEIAAYIARDSSRYAAAVISRILVAGRTLEYLPWRGRIVPELGLDDYREIFVHGYRLIYRIEDRRVKILAVIHGRRLLSDTRLGGDG